MHCETQEDAEIIHKMDMQVVERKRTVDVAGDTRCLEPWDGQSLKTLGIPGKKGPKTSKFGGNGPTRNMQLTTSPFTIQYESVPLLPRLVLRLQLTKNILLQSWSTPTQG